MQRVITINLNGHVVQLDERGYDALRAYLEHADAQLGGNPDKVEILRDLEQSIAEKLTKVLDQTKAIVSTADVEQVLREIGPVEGDAGWTAVPTRPGAANGGAARRLYQIREGGMISGLCNGMAAYFDVDPTFVRVAFVAAAIAEIAAFDRPPVVVIGFYVILVLIVPYSKTLSPPAATGGGHTSVPDKVRHNVERLKAFFGGVRHSAH